MSGAPTLNYLALRALPCYESVIPMPEVLDTVPPTVGMTETPNDPADLPTIPGVEEYNALPARERRRVDNALEEFLGNNVQWLQDAKEWTERRGAEVEAERRAQEEAEKRRNDEETAGGSGAQGKGADEMDVDEGDTVIVPPARGNGGGAGKAAGDAGGTVRLGYYNPK